MAVKRTFRVPTAERLALALIVVESIRWGFNAGVALRCNPKAPFHSIAALLRPERIAMQFCQAVARETRSRTVQELLMNDYSEIVRQ